MKHTYFFLVLSLLLTISGLAQAQDTWYTLASGDWDNPDIWTKDPAGAIPVGSAVPSAGDNVVIKTGKVVAVQVTDPAITLDLGTLTIDGGSLKLGATTGHKINTLRGSGKIYIQGNNFPTVTDASHFISKGKGEGTVVFEGNSFTYGSGGTDTFYNLEVNTNANQTVTLLNNLELNGKLTILQGTLQINDNSSTTALTLDVTDDITVNAAGKISVGTGNAIHRINASGDFKNFGSVVLSNANQYAAATTGAVNVNFTGNSDNDLVCNGVTTLYRMFLNKGSDRTYTLIVNANNANNFKLFGSISGTAGIEGSDGLAGWERLALVLNSGTLKLESNINIPQLGANRDGAAPNEFHIPSTAQLWINGATVATHESGGGWRGITVSGKLKVSAGSFTVPEGTGGITYFSNADNPGTLELTGGDVYATQLKQGDASGKFSYIQSGGTMHLNALADGRGISAIFALPGSDDYFAMSGGQIIIDAVNTATTNGIDIGSTLGNYNVTGGTIEIQTPTLGAGAEFHINSTAPFNNLKLTNSTIGGSQEVILQSKLTILNDLTIEASTTLNAADKTLEIGGAFTNDGNYTTGTNTTRFIGANPSLVNGDVNFSTLELNKESEAQTVTLGERVITISGNLTITKGNLDLNDKAISVGGNISVDKGNITTNTITAGKLVLSGGGGHVLSSTSENYTMGHVELNDADGASLSSNVAFDYFTLTSGIMDIGKYRMTVNEPIAGSGFGNSKMIKTRGQVSDKGLNYKFSLSPTGSVLYPVGVYESGNKYTPATFQINNAKNVLGTFAVAPVKGAHPASNPDFLYGVLDFYWRTFKTGFENIIDGDVSLFFDYYKEVDAGPWRKFYFYRQNKGEWFEHARGNRKISRLEFANAGGYIGGEFTAAVEGNSTGYNPFVNVRSFYSVNTGNWDSNSTWSHDATPGINDIVIIESGHKVSTNVDGRSAAQIEIKAGGTLDIGTTTGHNFIIIKGDGTFRTATGTIPDADYGNFVSSGTAIFEYYGSTDITTLPSSQEVYPNLHITGTGTKTTGDIDLTINGNLFVDDATFNISGDANGDVSISGDVDINTGTLTLPTGKSRIMDIDGNLTFSGTGTFNVAAGTTVEHHVNLNGNIVQGTGSIQLAEADAGAIVHFNGLQSAIFDKAGATNEKSEFYKIEINKPLGQNVLFQKGFTLPEDASDPVKNLILTSGECHLQSSNININLTTGGNDFLIPSGTTLKVDGATVKVGGDASNTGIWLDGSLIVDNNGTVNCNQGSNSFTDNYIEYSSSGDASIWIGNNSQLYVGSQIRRSLKTDVGLLSFSQNAASDTVIVGMNEAGNTSRGLFEIMGAGSSFTQAAGAKITIARGHGAGYRSLCFDPGTATLGTGSGFVIGSDTNTPANQEVGIYAAKPFNNLVINAHNAPKATLMVVPLSLQESLTIGAGAELDAAGLDVSIKGDFTNAGTYTANNNTTYFDGTNDQTITGITTFYNLVKRTTANTLNLASTIDVANSLSLLSGTLSTGANNLNVQGNVVNNATTLSSDASWGIVMNGTADIQELSGTGMFGRLTIDNNKGVVLPTQSREIGFTDKLVMVDGVFDIGCNLLVFGENAIIEAVNPFSNSNMIQTNLSFTDNGIKKVFPKVSGSTYNFIYPIGSLGKYTPVTANVYNNGNNTGSILVKAADEPVSAIVNRPVTAFNDVENVLQYNWTLDAEGINEFEADFVMQGYATDVWVSDGNRPGDYITARILLGEVEWNKFEDADYFDESTTELTFVFGKNGARVDDNEIDGDYTAGVAGDDQSSDEDDAIPDQLAAYITVTDNGHWDEKTTWKPYNPATGDIDMQGEGPNGGPRGSLAYIDRPVVMNANFMAAYRTDIAANGIIITGNTFGHRLGAVSGTGTIKVQSGDIPAGVYDEFFSASGGTLEFAGTNTDYEILGEITAVNNLVFSGSGTRRFAQQDLQLLGDWTLNGPAVINEHNKALYVSGDISFSGGSYNGRSGLLILNGASHQTVSGTVDFTTAGGGALYDLTIKNSTGVTLLNNMEVSNVLNLDNGVLSTKSGGSLTITNTSTSAVIGGGATSYVEGPLRKWINNDQSFVFPVGDAARCARTELSVDANSGGVWGVRYRNANPLADGKDPDIKTSPLEFVSHNEYWQVIAPNTGSAANMTLRWDDASGVTPDANFRVVNWNNSWEQIDRPLNPYSINTTDKNVSFTNALSFSGGTSRYLTFGTISIPLATWTGGADGDWFNASNWSDNKVPDASSIVTIAQSGTAPYIKNTTQVAQVNELTINHSDSLKIYPGGQLTVNGKLTTYGYMLVLNTNKQPASLITKANVDAVPANANVVGDITFKWTYDNIRWWFIGHGITNPLMSSYEKIRDPQNNDYVLYDLLDDKTFRKISNEVASYPLEDQNELKGYLFKVRDPKAEVVHTGKLNNEAGYSRPLQESATYDWQIMANPYPAYYSLKDADPADFVNTAGTVYVTESTRNSDKFFHTYNVDSKIASPKNNFNGILAPNQAFYIQTEAGKGGEPVYMKAANRMHDPNKSSLKSASAGEQNVLRLQLRNESGEADEAVIALRPDGDVAFTRLDSKQRFENNPMSYLYSLVDDERAVINVLPELSGEFSQPLGIWSKAGEHHLYIKGLETLTEDYELVLEDRHTGVMTTMKAETVYTFNTEKGTYEDRFVLHFKTAEVEVPTDIEDHDDASSVAVYVEEGAKLVVNCGWDSPEKQVSVYTVSGALVMSEAFRGDVFTQPLNLKPAIYIVKVNSDTDSYQQKVMIQ
ncbi:MULTISPECIES: T9SS type A sorting domain-containing protein [unclassified Carboxylicivirga]|uniref:T9SS type A sorting domain-containing protein n=1 Tax=Carboxylicivirga TaxID=1628153 RepID=UPI003D330E83